MGLFVSVEEPPKEPKTVVNNYNTPTQQQPPQTQIINNTTNSYEISLVLLALWSIPTMGLCCFYKYRKYGQGSIAGFLLGFLFKMSLK